MSAAAIFCAEQYRLIYTDIVTCLGREEHPTPTKDEVFSFVMKQGRGHYSPRTVKECIDTVFDC
jgi:hypothetical protein